MLHVVAGGFAAIAHHHRALHLLRVRRGPGQRVRAGHDGFGHGLVGRTAAGEQRDGGVTLPDLLDHVQASCGRPATLMMEAPASIFSSNSSSQVRTVAMTGVFVMRATSYTVEGGAGALSSHARRTLHLGHHGELDDARAGGGATAHADE